MFEQFYKALAQLDELRYDARHMAHEIDHLKYHYTTAQQVMQSQLDATEDLYEERREEMHPYIHKLTLAQWESMRHMNDEQFAAFKRRNDLISCECPSTFKYHALNCSVHPGEEQR